MNDGSTNGTSSLRLVLVGKSGAGKSASGNTILGGRKFDSRSISTSEDKACMKETVTYNGREVVVVDTPGYFERDLTTDQVAQDIRTCVTAASPGPHAIVLVVSIGRYTEEEKRTMERIQDSFGEAALRYMIVLFTRKDDLEELPIQDYIQHSSSKDLKGMIQHCGNRYCAFNNRATAEEREKQVDQLLTMIESMVEQNERTCYTYEMYQQAEKIHLGKLEEKLRQSRDPLEMEKERLKLQLEKEFRRLQEVKAKEESKRREIERFGKHTGEHIESYSTDHKDIDKNPLQMKRKKSEEHYHLTAGPLLSKRKAECEENKGQEAKNMERQKTSGSEIHHNIGSQTQFTGGNTRDVDSNTLQKTHLTIVTTEPPQKMGKDTKSEGIRNKAHEKRRLKEQLDYSTQSNASSRGQIENNSSDGTTVSSVNAQGELRLILVGKSGAGKSASGNTILGERKFDSGTSSTSKEKTCRKEVVNWKGRGVVVIDTPGFFDRELTPEQVVQDIHSCVTAASPGPHAIVLVVRIGRYTEEEKRTMERIQDSFGVEALRYMMVLFTRKDDLEDLPMQDYLQRTCSRDLQELMRMCGKRYCAFNNRAATQERVEQVNELLTMVERMVGKNEGTCYTNEMYQQAEKIHLKKLAETTRQNKCPLELEKERLKQQLEQEVKKIEKERQKSLSKALKVENENKNENTCPNLLDPKLENTMFKKMGEDGPVHCTEGPLAKHEAQPGKRVTRGDPWNVHEQINREPCTGDQQRLIDHHRDSANSSEVAIQREPARQKRLDAARTYGGVADEKRPLYDHGLEKLTDPEPGYLQTMSNFLQCFPMDWLQNVICCSRS